MQGLLRAGQRLFVLLAGKRHLGLGTHLHDLRRALLFLDRLAHFRQYAVCLVVVAIQTKDFLQVKLRLFPGRRGASPLRLSA